MNTITVYITIRSSGATYTFNLVNVDESIEIVRENGKPGEYRLMWKKPCVYSVQRLSKGGKWNDVARVVVKG